MTCAFQHIRNMFMSNIDIKEPAGTVHEPQCLGTDTKLLFYFNRPAL
jgi:hypothetical protein